MKTHLVIHHSLTKDSKTVSWPAIRRYHTDVYGWRDIGYNLGVEEINGSYEVLLGRPLMARAAAAYQQRMNVVGIHVCFIGNFDDEPPPIEMLNVAAPHLASIVEMANIPFKNIIGHRDVSQTKSCPGRMFDIATLQRLMKGVF